MRIDEKAERKHLTDARYYRCDTYAASLYELSAHAGNEVTTSRKEDGVVIGSTFRLPTPDAPPFTKSFSWGERMAGYPELKQFTSVPSALFTHRVALGLTIAHMALVVVLHNKRWTPDMPYPSQETLAEMADLSERTLARTAQDLEERGLLIVIRAPNQSNVYDLHPLYDALAALERKESPPQVDFVAIEKHRKTQNDKRGKKAPNDKRGEDTPAAKEPSKTQAIPKAAVAARLSDKEQAIQDEYARTWGRAETLPDVAAYFADDTSGSTYVSPDSPYGQPYRNSSGSTSLAVVDTDNDYP